MPCYQPLKGYRSPHPNSNGKYPFVFDRGGAAVIPCGKCIGCKLDRSRDWALRCVHEASLHDRNCLVTLTYDSAFLPPFGTLVRSDLQKFLKRLRKRFGGGIKFFACGEYGEAGSRPHYHICLFGVDFDDKKLWSVRGDVRLFVSESLNKLWSVVINGKRHSLGFASVGEVNFASAAYVARYTLKKVGVKSSTYYTRLVPETGELVSVEPEYVVMSRGGRVGKGIGKAWLDRFVTDVYPHSYVVHQGQKYKPPRYYDNYFESLDAAAFAKMKVKRFDQAYSRRANSTPERLKVREIITRSRVSMLKRTLV